MSPATLTVKLQTMSEFYFMSLLSIICQQKQLDTLKGINHTSIVEIEIESHLKLCNFTKKSNGIIYNITYKTTY